MALNIEILSLIFHFLLPERHFIPQSRAFLLPVTTHNSTLTTRKYGFQKLDLIFALLLKKAAKLELVAPSTSNWMVKS